MRCKQAQPRLVAFLLGEVSQREAEGIASHLPQCDDCMRELESLQATTRLLAEFAETESGMVAGKEMAAGLAERARCRSDRTPRPPYLNVLRWAPGVAALAAMATLFLLLSKPEATPPPSRAATAASPAHQSSQVARTPAPNPAAPARAESHPVGAGASSLAPVIGRVVTVTGIPQVRSSESAKWQTCRDSQPITAGTEIKTSDTDRLDVELADGSRMNLGFATSVRIERPSGESSSSRPPTISLKEGKVWLLVTPARAGFEVNTPDAKARALGTLFAVEVTAQAHAVSVPDKGPQPEPTSRTSLTVVRGTVQLANQWGVVTAGRETYTEATTGQAPRLPRGIEHLRTVRLQTPWGQTSFEVWVSERLTQDEALAGLAGKRSGLGIEVARAPAATGAQSADPVVVVTSVTAGSPGADAGIRVGDRLIAIASVRIASPADVARSELLLEPGRRVDAVVTRDGDPVTLKLTPAGSGQARPSGRDARVAAANHFFARGELPKAEKAYQAVIDAHEDCPEAWNNLALLRQTEERLDAAVSDYRQAIRLDPSNALYHYNLGVCFSQIGNSQRSLEELAAAVDRDPKLVGARFMLGRMSALAGEFDLAAQRALALRSEETTEAMGDFLTGEVLRVQGDLDASEPWYLRAAARDARYIDPAAALGAVYYDQGKLDAAKEWTDRALALDPSSLRALNRLGLILTKTRDLDGAERTLKTAVRLHPDSGIAMANLGRVHLMRGDARRAISCFRRSVQLAPNATLPHVLLAMGLERGGQFAEAKQEYAAALRLDPTYEEGYQRLAALHRRLGEVHLAESVLTRARRYGL